MKQEFLATYDYSGRVIIETSTCSYIYYMDGALVREIERRCRRSPGRVWKLCKTYARYSEKVGEKEMGKKNTETSKRIAAINDLIQYMDKHGHFKPVRSAKGTTRVAPKDILKIPCEHSPNDAILFFKWVHGTRKGIFDRLILVAACHKCKAKTNQQVFNYVDYTEVNVLKKKFNLNWRKLPKPKIEKFKVEKPKRKMGKAGLLQSTVPKVHKTGTFRSIGLKR